MKKKQSHKTPIYQEEWYEVVSEADFKVLKNSIKQDYKQGLNFEDIKIERYPCAIKNTFSYNPNGADDIYFEVWYQNKDGIYEIVPLRNWK